MDLGLSNKVAVVTGGSEGIGKAIALAFAREGAHVVICAHGAERLEQARGEISQAGGRVLAVAADLATAEGINLLQQQTLDAFGTAHVLVNNVGIVGRFASFMDLGDEEWQEVFNLNVMSAVRASRAFIPVMQQQKWGRIINMSSESGIQPDAEMPQYNLTKAALINLTKSLSKGFARDNILVNAIAPAFIMTPLVHGMMEDQAKQAGSSLDEAVANFLDHYRPHIELKRPGKPEEVASAALFLASEQASFITGSVLRVDGGSIASL